MCRVLAYVGEPISVDDLLYGTDRSLLKQTTSPALMQLMNLGGFGLAAWDPRSAEPDRPFVYRTPAVPVFDRNLKSLAGKVTAGALLSHVRGVLLDPSERVGPQNVHPFLFEEAPFALAQNGDLYDFGRMRQALHDRIPPELVTKIEGTTDTEWFYALCLAQLPAGMKAVDAGEMANAAISALRVVAECRAELGIETQSPINLVLSNGADLIATRYVFDYGWYPDDGSFFAGEREHDFTTLWFAAGDRYRQTDRGWDMEPAEHPRAVIVASEPLTEDTSAWLQLPEYSLLSSPCSDRRG